jgi:glyoxylase-like metal-dependent hydrolase (beta-lactamase superfamily II)
MSTVEESAQTGTGNVERIDVMHLGTPGVICCHRFGDVIIDPGPTTSVDHLVERLGDIDLRAIVLTHIHLDHAGGTGELVRRYPDAQVYVHEIGAPHLVDPSRLVSSATRVFGELMKSLWGEVVPVPAQNMNAISDGEVVHGLRAILTPGHSGHHLCYLHEDSGLAIVGDIFGQTRGEIEEVLLPTPPPEIDLDLWADSVRLLMQFKPVELGLTHFGAASDPEHQADKALAEIARVGEISQSGDGDKVVAYLEENLARMEPGVAKAILQAGPPLEQLWSGLERYWRKRDEAAAAN